MKRNKMAIKDPWVGKKVKVVADTCGHRVPVGTIVTISRRNGSSNSYFHNYVLVGDSTMYASIDFIISSQTVEELKQDLTQLEKEFAEKSSDIKSKLAYMQETETIILDEDEYKVYKTLVELENKKTTRAEKARIIAKLINS